MTIKEIETILDNNESIEVALFNEYGIYSIFDKEINKQLNESNYFGSYGEYYEMVNYINSKLFN